LNYLLDTNAVSERNPKCADDDHDRVKNLDHLTADQRAKIREALATIQRLAGPKGEPD
jgi:hypothetical protein